MAKTFYVIDGHAQIYRSYYAPFRPLTSPAGEPTRATYVFFSSLFNLLRERKPDYLAMVLDAGDETVFRCDIYPEYKAHRDPPPEDLPPQADRIVQIMRLLGVPVFCQQGFEADDLMATLVRRMADDADVHTYLVSKDKDLEQLITDKAFLYDPGKGEVIDRAYLLENKGYAPEQVIDVQTLCGDTVDNIPGVKGVGLKTAAKLIAKYGTAQAVVDHADELTPKQRENVLAFAAQLPITRQLVTLKDDVAFDFALERARYLGLNADAVAPVFMELGFERLIEQLEKLQPAGDAGGAAGAGQAGGGDSAAAPAGMLFAPGPTQTDAVYELVDDVAKLAALGRKLAGVQVLALDTETTGLNPVASQLVGISLAWEEGRAYYVPLRAAVGQVVPRADVQRVLGPVLADPAVRKVGQNLKYDLVVLRACGLPVAGVHFDTMIASFVLEPLRRSHGMDALALELLGHRTIPITDLIGKGKNQISLDQVDTLHVAEYAGEDAEVTWRLYEKLRPQVEASSTRRLFEATEMPLVEVLAEMEFNGVALDVGVLADMSDELADRMIALQREVHQAAGHEFNIDSTKQLATVLYDECGLPALKKTATGRSTDADTLERLAAETDHVIPKLMLEYRELAKLKGTYLDTLPRMVCARTGRVHAGFNQTGAVTGRLSSSDPNLQNIPVRTEIGRRIRGAFVAGADDAVLLVADYSQIELRILAAFSQDEALLAAFKAGEDIHKAVAAQVNGVPLARITPEQRYDEGGELRDHLRADRVRARALSISEDEAAFIDRYHARFPRMKAYIDSVIADVRATGYAQTILGRRRPIAELHSRNRQQVALGERLAVNTVIQGSAADLIKQAMVDIHRAIQAGGLATRMLIQVHDELVFEVKKPDVEAHTALIREKMTTALPLDVPIVVDIGVGRSWLEAK
ncbi:MAG: DNA polymerase I [Phycisphaerales bacterium]|nr:DNA polymerase I [Phycisphaerales bacterium]